MNHSRFRFPFLRRSCIAALFLGLGGGLLSPVAFGQLAAAPDVQARQWADRDFAQNLEETADQSTLDRSGGDPWPFAHQAASSSPFTFATPAAAATSDSQALLKGLSSLPREGIPGPVVIYGPTAFPIAVASDGIFRVAVGAAADFGKGRVVIFGHTAYLGDGNGNGDQQKLLLNAARWTSRRTHPRVGLYDTQLPASLEKAHLIGIRLDTLDHSALSRVDVLFLSMHGIRSARELKAVSDFVQKGNGLVCAMTGWALTRSYGNKGFITPDEANKMLAPAGLAFTGDMTYGRGKITVPNTPLPLLNATTAIAAFTPKPGEPEPDPRTVSQLSHTVNLALKNMPAELRASFESAIAQIAATAPKAWPSEGRPLIKGRDDEARARIALRSRIFSLFPDSLGKANLGKASPAAAFFPGRVAAGACSTPKIISIDPAIPDWQSTGLFADAGVPIKVILPPNQVAAGYQVRIGCHTDNLSNLKGWARMPEITTTARLEKPETVVANPFGGLVYIVVPDKVASAAPFNVSITGGYEAPLYVAGQTTAAQWQAMLKATASPWSELACKGVILSVPTNNACTVTDPARLMKFWQQVVDAEDDLANTAAKRRRPERMVADVQIAAGLMHSGYPFMFCLPQAVDALTLAPNKWPGWGFYHELGHNHQSSPWCFAGTTEVTCNLFSLYVVQTVEKRPMILGHPALSPQSMAKRREAYLSRGAQFDEWKSSPFLALEMYIQLLNAFGFDALKTVFRSYQDPAAGPLPKSDQEKRDQWMVRYAKTVNRNLGPFFDKWGVPVSESAKRKIADLPAWMPEGM